MCGVLIKGLVEKYKVGIWQKVFDSIHSPAVWAASVMPPKRCVASF